MKEMDRSPVVYLPELPKLGAKTMEDVQLYADIHQARMDLVKRLVSKGFQISLIGGQYSWLKTMLSNSQTADVYIFPPMTSLDKKHPQFKSQAAKRWFQFFSVVTGIYIGSSQQYHGECSKPCIVIDPDGQWNYAMDLLRDLRKKGMFSAKLQDICHIVKGDDSDNHFSLNEKAVALIQKQLLEGRCRKNSHIKSLYPISTDFKPGRRNKFKRHPFGTAVFGSATTKQTSYLQVTQDLTYNIAIRGWRMVTGAGLLGCMGAADRGFQKGKRKYDQINPTSQTKPVHIGVSTQQILCLEGPPQFLDHLIVVKDIYERMEIMIRGNKSTDKDQLLKDCVNIIYICPGGTGTLHQLATLLQLATNGGIMKYRKIIIVNPKSHLDPDQHFWDPLLRVSQQLGFKEFYAVANTVEQAMKISEDIYKDWQTRQ